VISGTQTVVISGTRSSWFQEPESALSLCAGNEIDAPNLSNIESFGFLLTERPHFHPVWKSPKTTRTTIVALFNQTGAVGKSTMALDPIGRWQRQRLRVIASDAGRKGENENRWLDWSKQRTKKGLTRLFHEVGLALGAMHRVVTEIALKVDHVVTGGAPRFAVRTRSALLATDVALMPFAILRRDTGRNTEPWGKGADLPPRPHPSLHPQSRRSSRPDRPRKGQGGHQARLAEAMGPRQPARGVQECCVQWSAPLGGRQGWSRRAGV